MCLHAASREPVSSSLKNFFVLPQRYLCHLRGCREFLLCGNLLTLATNISVIRKFSLVHHVPFVV